MIANISALVDKARAEHVPGDLGAALRRRTGGGHRGWQYVPELQRRGRRAAGAQDATATRSRTPTLEAELAQRGVGRLVVTGAQTDACIRATLHGAFVRGYDTTLVSDAHTTEDFSEYGLPPADKVIAHTNMYWTWQTGPGRKADVVGTADVSFDAAEAEAEASI